ncbi:hypothetical protein POJ06DRAFT_237766 [Lipomyces tetrasporus]|uniref:Protein kinase domain-containing protein n=1 Tax=Lipomyces tetrasporus TaxID=54092 RepID=A0AAD7QRX4_9ASCO|nr:uncharacterized protein POJ06DRAFT_237766 [Lipomyces tetrasporus]KAJ8100230.1 hypothetical protein POJ06DRAFT_237766 [Lipomyces tetrasporus]
MVTEPRSHFMPQNGNTSVMVRIRKHLRARSSRHSQIVLVDVEKSSVASCPISNQVVAKFFDPLFVSDDELPRDAPVEYKQLVAFRCYENEAAAYSSLSSLQGTVVPIFYGNYVCHFLHRPTESDQIAKVILMEHIDGWPLSWYSPGELTESQAQWIMRQMEDIVRQVHSQGVIHRDLVLRNFLLANLRRLVLVDFEDSEILNGENQFSPEALKEGDFIGLRCEFKDIGWLPICDSYEDGVDEDSAWR